MLLSLLAWRRGHFDAVYASLAGAGIGGGLAAATTAGSVGLTSGLPRVAVLLQLLAAELENADFETSSSASCVSSSGSAGWQTCLRGVLGRLLAAARCVKDKEGGGPPAVTAGAFSPVTVVDDQNAYAQSSLSGLESGLESARSVLESCLALLLALCQRDDRGAGVCCGADAVLFLQQEGSLRHLLALLSALEPVRKLGAAPVISAAAPPPPPGEAASNTEVQHAGTASGSSEVGTSGMAVMPMAPAVSSLCACYPHALPYRGYRADLLAVLATMSFRWANDCELSFLYIYQIESASRALITLHVLNVCHPFACS